MDSVKKRPELIIIAGPNGSGKTTITQKFLHHEWAEGTLYINPDHVAKDMFGDWNDTNAIIKAANFCAELRNKCLEEKKSLVFETVFSGQDKIDFLLKAKENGYFIRIFFVSTSNPSINASRIAVTPFIDRLYIYDNSIENQDAHLLFRTSHGMIAKQYSEEIPEWAIGIYNQAKKADDSARN